MKQRLLLIMSFVVFCLKGMNQQPPALPNCSGVACYMNASVQAFYSIIPLSSLLLKQDLSIYTQQSLAQSYAKLIQQLHRSGDFLPVLKELTKETEKILAQGAARQQDAPEFFAELINQLKASNNSEVNKAIEQLFSMQQLSVVNETITIGRDKTYDFRSQKEIMYQLFLPVALESGRDLTTLHDCLKAYFDKEQIEKVEATEVKKKLWLLNTPPYIIIQLNRSIYGSQKKDHLIAIGQKLDLKSYMYPEFQSLPSSYSLISAIFHGGKGAKSGHYIAYVKRIIEGKEAWYLCNDSTIKKIGNFEALKKVQDNPLDESYVLIYQKDGVVTQSFDAPFVSLIDQGLQGISNSLKELTEEIKKNK